MFRHAVIVLAVLLVCAPLTVGMASGAVSDYNAATGQSAGLLGELAPLEGGDAGDIPATAHNATENTIDNTAIETTDTTQNTTERTTDTTTETTQDVTTNTTANTTDVTQEFTDTTSSTSEDTTENITTTTQDATTNTTDNTTETTQERPDQATPSDGEVLNTTTSTTSGSDTLKASTSTENATTSADGTDGLEPVMNATGDTSKSASGLTEDTTASISMREDTLATADSLNETLTDVTAELEQQWSETNLTDGPAGAFDSARDIAESALSAPVSTDVEAEVSDSLAVRKAGGQRNSNQQAPSTSTQRLDSPAATQPTDGPATETTAENTRSETRTSLMSSRSSSQPVPGWGGTAAVGGAVLLGLGYVGRRVAATHLLTGAGLPRWRNLSPVIVRIQAAASLMRGGFRAGEFKDPLRHLPLIGGYSRWDDTDPLEHKKRATIYEHLEEQPGTYLSSLSEVTGIALPTVRYHLKILKYEGCIESEVIRGKRRFFPAHFDAASLVAALEDDATRRVLEALRIEEPASVSQLADILNRDPGTITHHCKRLEAEGLINRRRDGRAKLASLTPEVRDALRTMDTPNESSQPTVADD